MVSYVHHIFDGPYSTNAEVSSSVFDRSLARNSVPGDLAQPSRHFVPRCGAVLILRSLAQPSRHFGRVRPLSMWRGAHFATQGDLVQRSWQGCFLWRACAEILPRRPLIKILYRDPLKRSCTDILVRGLLQRYCQQISYRDLAKRALIKILCRDL